ncbi:MAG: class I SAM-dependent methyltransferase [Actinobacteria bacterium]|nr:class I SAM-dependent methyltransferase [Actinomycetota bacterium]
MMSSARDFAVQLLGEGAGRCLDLGCGTGLAIPALTRAGWSVVGTDVSTDQLEAAREHAGDLARLVRGDAHALPLEDGGFDAVISVLTHTDLDDVRAAFTEASRVLRVGGAFVYLGVHPCFASPFVAREAASGIEGAAAILHPGYRSAGWHRLPAEASSTKIRARVAALTTSRLRASSTRSSGAALRSHRSRNLARKTLRSSWRSRRRSSSCPPYSRCERG